MLLTDRLAALDTRVLGRAQDPGREPTPRWVTVAAAGTPVLAGGTAMAAFLVDRGAGVGVLLGMLVTVPIAAAARASGQRAVGLTRRRAGGAATARAGRG